MLYKIAIKILLEIIYLIKLKIYYWYSYNNCCYCLMVKQSTVNAYI
jgi:hypothetical protein